MTVRKGQVETAEYIRRVLIVLALASLAFLVWHLRYLVVMLFAAVVVASVFRAIATPFEKRMHIPEKASVGIAILIVLGLIGGLFWLFGSEIGRQTRTLSQSLPEAIEALEAQLASWGLADEARMWLAAPSPDGGNVISSAMRFVVSLSGGIADTLVVVFGGIFVALQPRLYRMGAVKLFPKKRRPLLSEAMDDSERALRLWLKAQLISMTFVGILTAFGLWLIGVQSWLVLGLLAFALEFIPFAGPVLAAIPAILIALSMSPELALWTLGLYVLIQQLEGNLIYPLVQQWAVHVPAVVLLFALLAFASLFGTIGVIFAAPLTVVSYVLVKRLYVREALQTPTPIPGEQDK